MKSRPNGKADKRTPEQIQHEFYSATAEAYDGVMVADNRDPHFVALNVLSTLVKGQGYGSVLDVGTGTGRAIRHLVERHPDLAVRGVEPVPAMIAQAERVHGIAPGQISEASGYALPFSDGEFDVVAEFGVLHHVAEPERVVREMTRVARRAVVISDDNRFAHGHPVARLIKYGLWRAGAWPLVYRLTHGGRGYHLTEEDGGVAYSYSVYDSVDVLNGWADRIFVVPTVPAPHGVVHPLFGAPNLVVCAMRDA